MSAQFGPVCSGLHLLCPHEDEIDMVDIAVALTGLRRWCGRGPTTVAQHSLYLATLMEGPEAKLLALLHDAPEAYMSDIPRPMVELITQYGTIHAGILAAIYRRLRVPFPSFVAQEAVTHWDDRLCECESDCPTNTATGALNDQDWYTEVAALAAKLEEAS
jgi:hypothetical protein